MQAGSLWPGCKIVDALNMQERLAIPNIQRFKLSADSTMLVGYLLDGDVGDACRSQIWDLDGKQSLTTGPALHNGL